MYLTGTIQTDRAGYAKRVITKKEIRQVNKQKIVIPPQGTIKLAANERFPQLTAIMSMDRTPVYLLSSGAVDSAETYQTIEVRYQSYIIVQESNVVSATLTWHFNQRATTARERAAASPSRETVSYAPAVESTVDIGGHRLEENPDTVDNEQGLEKRQRSCKVCALFKTKPRKYTKYFCPDCSTGNRRYVNVSQLSP
ncbi:unnamed protein product [Phytophthora fragariaefolia]|uniref:Unnamed protein product n=1 Tax=Phytophthora fragariaefolia TaxID=1490495 RepID=A0A9W6TM25_9STRA|nr:unnamed protein product [Phytophthora fragariaefolia]